ncbi:MAG: polysaccharide biosynthesis C-terminal domain-containing protein [Bacteroidetes bacterium]|nr:polysaccharide biosynthesis C-terminal domain-containing protein [Bacteroidota bacterium]MBX7129314.1 polysaccharide biosynthesis C-terminal domain-containing protein [Flavobacteriales bacterium]MCC6655314.1 polysaccharide biosynthesis C-terminal domain-containing protein [Flavobacteriales bacterium]HMU12555.1 polysaccharide biosynthesis C-terminal domain-containing protein [Flavobacteriales bacterium]HMW96614.1 polysaccharide biosynthesis C-terminal domain-containing protein [Flavobacterial
MSIQRSILHTFLAQVPTLALFFLASVLMTNVLGDDGRGAFALMQNLVIFMMMGLGLNFSLGLMYHTARSGGDQRVPVGMASSLFLVNLVAVPSILGIIIFSDALRGIFFPGRLAHPIYFAYVAVSVLMGQVITFVSAMVQGLKLFTILNRMSIVTAAFSCTGFVLIWCFRGMIDPANILPYTLLVTVSGVTMQAVIWSIIYVRKIGLPPVPLRDWTVMRPFLAFSLMGYLTNMINLVNYRLDIWIVDQFSGTANLGLYAAAVGVGQLFFNIPEPLSRVVQPYLYSSNDDGMMERFRVIARLNFTAVTVLCIFTAIIAPWLLPLMYGPDFSGSVTALRLLLPGIAFCGAYKLLAVVLIQRGLLRFNLYGSVIAALTTVVLDLVLIPAMGITGASIASSIAYLAILGVTCLVLRYRLNMPVAELFLLRPSDFGFLRTIFLKSASPPAP